MEHIEQAAPFLSVEPAQSGIEADKHHAARLQDIALSAYYCAQARGGAPGGEVEDWLAVEREIATRGADA